MSWITGWSGLLLCPSLAFAGGLESAVPADVWAFFGCDNVAQMKSEIAASDFGRLWSDPAMTDLRSGVFAAIDQMRGQATATAGADPIEIFEWVEGGAALVVFDQAAADPKFFQQAGASIPRLGLLLGGGDRADAIATRVGELLAKEIEAGRGIVETRDVNGVTVTRVREVRREDDLNPSPEGELSYAVVAGTFVATIQPNVDGDREEIDELLHGLKGELDATLADDAAFTASVAGAGGQENSIRGFVDVGRISRQALDALAELEPESTNMARALGIDRLGPLAMRGTWSGTNSLGWIEWKLEGETALGEIFSKAFPMGPLHTLGRISAKSASTTAFHLDIGAGLDAVLAFLDQANPEAAAEARMGLDMMATPDFDFRRDLLGPLGDEFSVVFTRVENELEALPGTEDDPQTVTVLVELDDGAAIESLVDKFVEEQGLAAVRETAEFEGKRIVSIPTPLGLTMSYCIVSDMLVMSPSTAAVQDVLRRTGTHELPTFAGADSYVAARKEFALGDWTVESSTDTESIHLAFAAFGETLAMMGLSGGTQTSVDPEVVDKYMTGTSYNFARLGTGGFFMVTGYRGESK